MNLGGFSEGASGARDRPDPLLLQCAAMSGARPNNRVTIDAGAADSVRRGRPWVLREAILGRPVAETGDLVDLHEPRGAFVARGLADPDSPISVRVLTRDPGERDLRALVLARVQAAFALRRRLCELETLEVYRLCNGEGDGLSGLAIELYGPYAMVELTAPAWQPHREAIVSGLRGLFADAAAHAGHAIPSLRGIVEKSRLWPGQGGEVLGHLWGEEPPETLWVREGAARFCVELRGTNKTGLFIDQRETRKALITGNLARGGAVLNGFSFTGSLSVAAGLGGARSVTSLDLSAPALTRARRNFEGNGLDPARHEVLQGDAFAELPALIKAGRRFDTVILDPPAFAQTKKRVFQADRDYVDLAMLATKLLVPGGIFIASTPMASLPASQFERSLHEGALRAGSSLCVFDVRSQPADHPVDPACPEKRYLKLVFSVRR